METLNKFEKAIIRKVYASTSTFRKKLSKLEEKKAEIEAQIAEYKETIATFEAPVMKYTNNMPLEQFMPILNGEVSTVPETDPEAYQSDPDINGEPATDCEGIGMEEIVEHADFVETISKADEIIMAADEVIEKVKDSVAAEEAGPEFAEYPTAEDDTISVVFMARTYPDWEDLDEDGNLIK